MCRDGEAAGLAEGRELGEHKGHEIGAEIGFYRGFIEARHKWRTILHQNSASLISSLWSQHIPHI